jgi:hypothetical protein
MGSGDVLFIVDVVLIYIDLSNTNRSVTDPNCERAFQISIYSKTSSGFKGTVEPFREFLGESRLQLI